MRSLIKGRKSLLPTLGVLSASVLVSVSLLGMAACGGDKSGDGVKSPGTGTPTEGTSSGASASGSGGSSSGSPGSSGGAGAGTTTTALGDGGDLQGAKLGSSSHTEVETKGDGGPKVGAGHQQEPGRKREDIQTIVMARRDDDKGLKDHPGIEGDLTIKFVIDPTGTVTDASVDTSKSSILEPGVGNCIIEVIKKIKFAASKGGFETRANYPFNFHPKTFGGAKDAGK